MRNDAVSITHPDVLGGKDAQRVSQHLPGARQAERLVRDAAQHLAAEPRRR